MYGDIHWISGPGAGIFPSFAWLQFESLFLSGLAPAGFFHSICREFTDRLLRKSSSFGLTRLKAKSGSSFRIYFDNRKFWIFGSDRNRNSEINWNLRTEKREVESWAVFCSLQADSSWQWLLGWDATFSVISRFIKAGWYEHFNNETYLY